MTLSLREQLLAAGLGSKKQARDAERDERQTRHQQVKQPGAKRPDKGPSEQEKRAAQAQAAKAARDQELNRKRQEEAARRARWAEIKQLIEQHRLPKSEGDEYFNFIDRQKVRRISADSALRDRITRGELAIVRCEGRYDIVTVEIAARIGEREERAVVKLDQKQDGTPEGSGDDDPYKDFVVPDDLRW
jgi:uncharacterized protein YaiL (DUF2058 family)